MVIYMLEITANVRVLEPSQKPKVRVVAPLLWFPVETHHPKGGKQQAMPIDAKAILFPI